MTRHKTSGVRRPASQVGALLFLGNGLVLAAALAGGFFAFCTAYGLEGNTGVLMAACCILAALSLALWSLPRGGYPGALAALAAVGLAAWRKWEILWPALRLVGMHLEAVRSGMWIEGPDGTVQWYAVAGAAPGLPLALLLLMALLALALGWAVVRARRWWLVLALTFLPVLPAILAGILPNWRALMAAAAASLALLLTGLYSRRDQTALGRSLLVSLGASALLLAALTASLPQKENSRPQWATDAKERLGGMAIQGFEAVLDWELPGTGGAGEPDIPGSQEPGGAVEAGGVIYIDGGGGVDLTAAGPRRYTGRTVLQVEGQETGRVYLRGESAAVYTGRSWEAISGSAYGALDRRAADSSLLFPAWTALDTETLTMTIRPVNQAVGVACVPYQLAELPEGELSRLWDTGLIQEGLRAYEVTYRPIRLEEDFTALEGVEAGKEEEAYRAFVYDNYLEVPLGTEALLEPLLSDMERQTVAWPSELPEQYQQAVAAARRAAGLLSSMAYYDLNTPAMDPDGDFLEHFFSQGRGYCVHFATAGCLLLRLSGVPARYVSGYVADLDQSGKADVPDYAAHAWVEIYLDGYGWYPVEMTPAYSGQGGETPAGVPRQEQQETPQTPSAPDGLEEDGGEPLQTGRTAWRLALRWLGRAALLLAAAAVLALPRLLAVWLRRRREKDGEPGSSVIAAYRYYRRLLPWGGEESPELEELARRAAFSHHPITREERQRAWDCAHLAARRTEERLPGWKRPAFRWLWLLGDGFSFL